MKGLNRLMVTLAAGVSLSCDCDINRDGWIVGVAYATDFQGLHYRAFLLRPIADLAHLHLLLLVGGFGG
jgi:hypothetical protein